MVITLATFKAEIITDFIDLPIEGPGSTFTAV
jgi:hypothetical protein